MHLQSVIITILAVIFVFGLLIASHELGHFLTCKAVGVKVVEFSLGMGPRIAGFTTKETKYSIRLIPIGGYVKMLGEEEESKDPRAFCNQSPWRRLLIIVAGAFMNFVIAVVIFVIYTYNVGFYKPVVSETTAGSPAYRAGIKAGDRVVYVNDVKISMWEEFTSFVNQHKDETIKLTVERDGKQLSFDVKPELNKEENRYMIGISATPVKGNIGESITQGFITTGTSIKEMIKAIGGMITGSIPIKESLGGPVAIVKMSGEAARLGFWTLLYFTGFLSINLGVFNLLPFPALDGGWVIILLFEGITGKKIDENKIGMVNLVGFTLLIIFAILVTIKDIGLF